MIKMFLFGFSLLWLSGCTSYGVINNEKQTEQSLKKAYSLKNVDHSKNSSDISLVLAFSGGGTRAAAFSYGVLQELRDTTIIVDGKNRRLLDEVDIISSVSGGSFTSAYYGLYGDRIFEDFEDVFLRKNIQASLFNAVLNPALLFTKSGRTELAIKFYEDNIFHGATFSDMKKEDHPLILINATDLGHGVRFSFIQEYFSFLCSDINSFPVARAVTASSAVPILFNPVVLENYSDCKTDIPDWLLNAEQRAADNPELMQTVEGLKKYFNKTGRNYSHFVDGGITDNLGLRAIYELIELTGGANDYLKHMKRNQPRQFIQIAVNASTDPVPKMDKSNQIPSIQDVINSMSSVQLQRYNTSTIELMKSSMTKWSEQLSTSHSYKTQSYFVELGFKSDSKSDRFQLLNQIPTSFSLTNEQVDELIQSGRETLSNNLEFQRFLSEYRNRL